MGMGPFSSDESNVKQTSTQQQQGVQGGQAYGAINDIQKAQGGVFGGGSSGNVSIKVDKNAFSSSSKSGNAGGGSSPGAGINVVTYDPAAALEAIHASQATSTQAISYGAIVATNALEALRSLQGGKIVADADGSGEAIVDALGTQTTPDGEHKKSNVVIALGVALTVVAIVYYYSHIKP